MMNAIRQDINRKTQMRQARVQEEKILDAKARRVILSEIAKGKDVAAAIRAIDILNKMDGEYIRKPQNESIFDCSLDYDFV